MSASAVTSGRIGNPPLVLIHGLGGSHRVWDRVMPDLEPDAYVYAVDLNAGRSIEDDADAVAALMTSSAVVVGHSRGGLVATAIAERHPDLVRHLVLFCAPWSVESRLTSQGSAERLLATPVLGALIWAIGAGDRSRQALRSAFAPGSPFPDQFVHDLRKRGHKNFVRSSQAIDSYLARSNLLDRLARISKPVVLASGELDARVSALPKNPKLREGVRYEHLHGVGHTPPWEAPEFSADLILRALAFQRQ